MKKKIFRSVFLSMIGILVVALAFIAVSLDGYMVEREKNILIDETNMVAVGTDETGIAYLHKLDSSQYRITWVNAQGQVLYDNRENPQKMENHADREEINEAMEQGTGYSERYSDTLGQKTMYYAQKLKDGSVIRVAVTRDSIGLVIVRMLIPLVWIFLGAMGVSALAAYGISHSIVDPLNDLDLDNPEKNRGQYPELQPLLDRLSRQNTQISGQMEELKRREKEFRTITDALQEGLILLRPDGSVFSANPAAQELFGLKPNLKLPDDLNKLVEKMNDRESLNDIVQRAGKTIRVDIHAIEGRQGRAGLSLLAYDDTEEYEAEMMRKEFTANVSHELKTPLQTIMGSAELLENHLVKKEDESTFYQKIHQESARMLTLIDDIIRLSRLDEETNIPQTALELQQPVKEAISALQSSANRKHITLDEQLQNGRIIGNERLVYEIAYNLIDNAIRYTREEGQVRVSIYPQNDQTILQVQDNGIGIPQEALPRIYERFYRVDKSHSRQTGGTGLGLSIVKHAVQLSDAHIEVASEVGKGTVFTVRFKTYRG